jgi:hypothetical protein
MLMKLCKYDYFCDLKSSLGFAASALRLLSSMEKVKTNRFMMFGSFTVCQEKNVHYIGINMAKLQGNSMLDFVSERLFKLGDTRLGAEASKK